MDLKDCEQKYRPFMVLFPCSIWSSFEICLSTKFHVDLKSFHWFHHAYSLFKDHKLYADVLFHASVSPGVCELPRLRATMNL